VGITHIEGLVRGTRVKSGCASSSTAALPILFFLNPFGERSALSPSVSIRSSWPMVGP